MSAWSKEESWVCDISNKTEDRVLSGKTNKLKCLTDDWLSDKNEITENDDSDKEREEEESEAVCQVDSEFPSLTAVSKCDVSSEKHHSFRRFGKSKGTNSEQISWGTLNIQNHPRNETRNEDFPSLTSAAECKKSSSNKKEDVSVLKQRNTKLETRWNRKSRSSDQLNWRLQSSPTTNIPESERRKVRLNNSLTEDFPSLLDPITSKKSSKSSQPNAVSKFPSKNTEIKFAPKEVAKGNDSTRKASSGARPKMRPTYKQSTLADYISWRRPNEQTVENKKTKTKTNERRAVEEIKEPTSYLKIQTDLLTIEKLQDLKDEDDSDYILLTVSQENNGFNAILNRETLSDSEVCLVMKMLSKACRPCRHPERLLKLLVDVEKSLFLNFTVPAVLTKMKSKLCKNSEKELNEFIDDILIVLLELSQRLPHAITTVCGVSSYIECCVNRLAETRSELSEGTQFKINELEETKTSLLKKMENNRIKSNRMLKSADISPPNDFRTISVMPTYDDIYPTTKPFLRKIKETGGYQDLDDYLDVQFRLLREDFIEPLRQGVRDYLFAFQNPRQPLTVRTYHNVKVVRSGFSKDRFVHTVTFDTPGMNKIQWEHTKRLIYGTLVCLSNDNYETFSLASVDSRPKQVDEDEDVTVDIFIEYVVGERPIDLSKPMVMIETTAYFEAYRYVLSALQNIRKGQLPFEEYIVFCKRDIRPPRYLRNKPYLKYDFDAIANNSKQIVQPKRTPFKSIDLTGFSSLDDVDYCDSFTADQDKDDDEDDSDTSADMESEILENSSPILNLDLWPQPEYLNLDVAQFKAFQQALTKEFVIIQGPPGTGKTYVGLKIVKTLLFNCDIWQHNKPRPMLVLCYTNHALDQFLEGILSFHSGSLVRVGGRCKSDKVREYGIRELRTRFKFPHEEKDHHLFCQTNLLRIQKHLKLIKEGIVKKFVLNPVISQTHYKQLSEIDSVNDPLLDWLQISNYFESSQPKDTRHKDNVDTTVSYEHSHSGKKSNDKDKQTYDEDGEADIAEAERKLDVEEDFEELIKLPQRDERDILSAGCHRMSRKDEFLANIQCQSAMTEVEERAVSDILSLSIKDRWRLYRYWMQQLHNHLENEMAEVQQQCIEAREEYRIAMLQTDKAVMKKCSVIGMTTSGAARYQKILSELKPRIIIIEEAAEVLEAHVTASLSSECEHLILIGDHQQLRPSPNVYLLAKQYNLELSLFERMVNNGLECVSLEKQHRMRPSITKIMKFIYPRLRDDASVENYPNILGVCSNVFFINHSANEKKNIELWSHLNVFEARYIIALCLYLIKQGYEANEITILTAYSGQVAFLKQNMPADIFKGVRVTPIDNYQGEENDIILLSLVRSNEEGNVGFLKIDNRVCVALSRARKGLFVIGNFNLLRTQSDLWENIVDYLESEGQLGNALFLYCQNHPQDAGIKASKAEDFSLAPEGGCLKPCTFELNCGHVCAKRCHPVDPQHSNYKCEIPCERVMPLCHHKQTMPCWIRPENFDCKHPVIQVGKCGHEAEVHCYLQGNVPCAEKCNTVLKCGHVCKGLCYKCFQGRLHVACTEKCNRILICGHKCQKLCSHCPPCQLPCDRCSHESCKNKCSEPCSPCPEKCTWTCKDKKCTKNCSDLCNRLPCNKKCPRILECGHRCLGLCGEKCPHLCIKCSQDELCELTGKEISPDALFIELEDCGHLIEVSVLDKLMETSEFPIKIQLKQCPWCETHIRHSKRYGDAIRQTMQDITVVKRLMKDDFVKWERKIKDIASKRAVRFFDSDVTKNIEGCACVINQLRFIDEVKKIKIEKYSQLQDEIDIFVTWLLVKRYVFTEQEIFDAQNEIKRLKLFGDVNMYDIKCTLGSVTDEEKRNMDVVKQYISDGKPYSPERQQEVHNLLPDTSIFSELSETVPVETPITFTAGHWFRCKEGHIYNDSKNDNSVTCPTCLDNLPKLSDLT